MFKKENYLNTILTIIGVVAAICVGFYLFNLYQGQSNQEAILIDIKTIAANAQSWFRKPRVLGGGNYSFENITLENIGFNSENKNGSYFITKKSKNKFEITAIGKVDQDQDGILLTIKVIVSSDKISSPLFVSR